MNEKERLQLEQELLLNCSKAQAINKYIDELEESSLLSELWCKSQEENKQLQDRIDKAIEELDNFDAWLELQDTLKIIKIKNLLRGKDE